MAMPNCASTFVPKLEIEAVQTVTPFKVTDPRERCKVSVKEHISPDIFRGCLNIVLYYNKAAEEDSGWLVAGWIKESLSRALKDQPMLSGRLRRGEDGNGGELEMVSNDSGVRLVETKIEISMKEFLDFNNKERENSEAELVFWKDIDDQNPQHSPLCYVQVTNFQCGGYSIGISCSLLLADFLIINNFLLRWANIQKDLISNNDGPKQPIFYLPSIKNTSSSSATSIISSTPSKNYGQTMIFKVAGKIVDLKNEPSKKAAALICIEEAECKLGREMSTGFSFFEKESSDIIKLQNCKKQELVNSDLNLRSPEVISSSSLDDIGIKELAFHERNRPASVSCWIGSVTDGLVMAIPSHNEELHVVVTIPI